MKTSETGEKNPGQRITSPSSGNASLASAAAWSCAGPQCQPHTCTDWLRAGRPGSAPFPLSRPPIAPPGGAGVRATRPRAPRHEATELPPGGGRAASFCYGYDARACASGPPQNWPHSRRPQCQPGTCRQRPTGTHAPFPLSRCRQEPGQRGPRDPIRPPPDCEPSAQPGLTRAGPAWRVPLRLADWRLEGSARLLQKPAGRRKTSCPWLGGKQTARARSTSLRSGLS